MSPQIKWDTIALNSRRNSLKTNNGGTHKVGHFFDSLLNLRKSPGSHTLTQPPAIARIWLLPISDPAALIQSG